MKNNENTEPTQGWDTYWQGTGGVGAFTAGGVAHPDINAFWQTMFTTVSRATESISHLDIATGNGAVIELAQSIFDRDSTQTTCVDISEAAIDNVTQRFPGVSGVVADACSIPLQSSTYNLVTSQFGVEYAGLDAVVESGRLVSEGGQLVLMMHIQDGLVHRECQASLTAIQQLQAANFVPLAIEFFECGFAAVRGEDRRAYDEAGTRLSPAIEAAEAIMAEFGEGVAGETISRLYVDVGRIHNNLPNYEPAEVNAWLGTIELELRGYAERMTSMIEAAIAPDTFGSICQQLGDSGFSVEQSGSLMARDQQTNLAWILVATR